MKSATSILNPTPEIVKCELYANRVVLDRERFYGIIEVVFRSTAVLGDPNALLR